MIYVKYLKKMGVEIPRIMLLDMLLADIYKTANPKAPFIFLAAD